MVYLLSVCVCTLLFLSGDVCESFFFTDQVSGYLTSLSVFLTAVVLVTLPHGGSMAFLLVLSMVVVEVFFLSKSLVLFFITFELSIIPMGMIILGWSGSSERISATKFMMLYTLIASAPLFGVILWMDGSGVYLFPTPFYFECSSKILFMFGMFAFLVKVPVYLCHSWLPRAHVEAPLQGSMVLAGLMLKVGVYGFFRVCSTFPPESSESSLHAIFALSLVGSVVPALLAMSSDDLKMGVAYSSVSHMNMSVVGLATLSEVAPSGGLISMVSHGFSSPLMFYVVALVYQLSHSRSVLINKGLLSSFPMLKSFLLCIWAMNMAIPPFLPFLGEVKLLSSVCWFSSVSVGLIFPFILFGSSYSLLTYGILSHSSKSAPLKGGVSQMKFMASTAMSTVVMIESFSFF